ncbi:hypothetical protein BDA96_10G153700 [Sorghum bicolor]|uniref:Uncharacterized protein n=1 Tax=Sorghum bicolor TaxID=4558 RepID=A0A921Q1V6_SORBI|nr:hypothetical protein BDA96_10G153700 [Sorghum bicolor]
MIKECITQLKEDSRFWMDHMVLLLVGTLLGYLAWHRPYWSCVNLFSSTRHRAIVTRAIVHNSSEHECECEFNRSMNY